MTIDRQTTTTAPYHNTNAKFLWSYKNHIFILTYNVLLFDNEIIPQIRIDHPSRASIYKK